MQLLDKAGDSLMKIDERSSLVMNESINAYTGKESTDDQLASDWSSQPIPLPVISRGHSSSIQRARSWSYEDYLSEFDDQPGGDFSSLLIPLPDHRQ